jgi:F-type H+-transporting ATPase subunit delta
MAELTTIARPYAEAAFRLARENDALPAWLDMLRLLDAVVADSRMAVALDNPKLTADKKEAMVLAVTGDRLDALGRNFVRVLVASDRLAVLPQIVRLFEALKNDAEGVAEASIESAFPLTDTQVADLKAALEKRFGKKIEATVTVDAALIGGARVTVGDTVLDGSVQAQLEAMATQLRA